MQKYTLLIIGLLLTLTGCGSNEAKAPSAIEYMNKAKMVRILTDAVNTPFEFGAGTGVQGLDVDLGNEVAKDLGVEVKWGKSSGDPSIGTPRKSGFSRSPLIMPTNS